MYQKALEGNIWKYTVILVTNKRIFAAILAVYYLTIPDVTAQTVGFILLVANVAGFLFEIPSGYLSDKLGHKHAIVISRFIMVLSTVCFLIADDTLLLILGAVFLNISWAFMSGTGAAFMHETLRGLGREEEYSKVVGKASAIGFAVPIVLTVLTPFLVGISFKLPFVVALVTDLVGLIVAISLTKPLVTPEEIKEINTTNFQQVIHAGYKLGFFKYAIFTVLGGSVLFAASLFRAPYQELLGISVIWFGVLFGLGRAAASLLLAYSGKMREYFGTIVSFFKFKLWLFTLLIILLATTADPIFVATMFIILNAFQWGLSQVSRGFMLDIIKDSKFKATLLSTQSQINSLFNGVLTFVLGVTIEHSGYQIAFFSLAAFYFFVSLPLYFYIKRNHTFGQIR